MVLFILAVVWAVYLVIWVRSRSEHRSVNSISSFNKHLSVLERTSPGRGAAPTRIAGPAPQRSARLVGPARVRPDALPASARMTRSQARERRKNVLIGLAGAVMVTLVLAIGRRRSGDLPATCWPTCCWSATSCCSCRCAAWPRSARPRCATCSRRSTPWHGDRSHRRPRRAPAPALVGAVVLVAVLDDGDRRADGSRRRAGTRLVDEIRGRAVGGPRGPRAGPARVPARRPRVGQLDPGRAPPRPGPGRRAGRRGRGGVARGADRRGRVPGGGPGRLPARRREGVRRGAAHRVARGRAAACRPGRRWVSIRRRGCGGWPRRPASCAATCSTGCATATSNRASSCSARMDDVYDALGGGRRPRRAHRRPAPHPRRAAGRARAHPRRRHHDRVAGPAAAGARGPLRRRSARSERARSLG